MATSPANHGAASVPADLDGRLRAAGLGPIGASAWVEVDLDALEANARVVRRLLPAESRLGIVVKANGYGHGLEMAARAAVTGGADWLIVATVDEGRNVRAAGITIPTLATYPPPPVLLEEAAELDLDVTVGDEASIKAAIRAGAARARRGGTALGLQLEVDTGMSRGGVPVELAAVVASRLATAPGIRFRGIWSHLASGDDAASTRAQVERYERVLTALATAGIVIPLRHVAASESLFRQTCPAYDLVRVGDAFYGGADTTRPTAGPPLAAAAAELRPALALKARAVRIAEVPPGTEVGYGGTWRAERPSLIATLPLGYADGVPRSSSPGAVALVRGRPVPLVGRVSMDAIGVDVTDAGPVGHDDEFVLVGEQAGASISAADAATARGTIARELVSSLGPRLPRVYLQGGRPVAVASLPPARIARTFGG